MHVDVGTIGEDEIPKPDQLVREVDPKGMFGSAHAKLRKRRMKL